MISIYLQITEHERKARDFRWMNYWKSKIEEYELEDMSKKLERHELEQKLKECGID